MLLLDVADSVEGDRYTDYVVLACYWKLDLMEVRSCGSSMMLQVCYIIIFIEVYLLALSCLR
jgi:hypothetical protein